MSNIRWIIANEAVDDLKRRKRTKLILFKVNFKKICDSMKNGYFD